VSLIAVLGLTSVLEFFRLSRSIDDLMTDNYKSINAVQNMLECIERQDSAVLLYLNESKRLGADIFVTNSEEFLKWYNVEYSNITEKGEKEYVDNLVSFGLLTKEQGDMLNKKMDAMQNALGENGFAKGRAMFGKHVGKDLLNKQ
jgi:hypothetical protein